MNIPFTFPEVRTVIDVGASDGRWSNETRNLFPNAEKWLLVEPLEYPNKIEDPKFLWEHVIATDLAEASRGPIPLSVSADSFGSGVYDNGGDNVKLCPGATLDHLIFNHKLQGPFFLKTDAHGMEYLVLSGLDIFLDETTGVLMELYNFPEALSSKALPWYSMCSVLATVGFRPLDIADIMRRPCDKTLWQLDVLFARPNRAEFSQKSYA